MEMSPDSSPAKRARAKPKVAPKEPVAAKPVAAKKPRAARKSPTTTQAEMPMAAAPLEPSEDVGGMIATAAYYLAAARDFAPGYELDDWLEAERTVHAKLYS